MKRTFYSDLISITITLGLLSLIMNEILWAPYIGLIMGLIIFEGIRHIRRKNDNNELEFDERVNSNLKQYMLATLTASNLLLLTYVIVKDTLLNKPNIENKFLLIYLITQFLVAFIIVPIVVKRV